MTPTFRGLLVSSVAAPYLCLLFIALLANGFTDDRIPDAVGWVIGGGTLALVWAGVPVFLIGGVVSGMLETFGLRSQMTMIAGGAAVGFSFLTPLLLSDQKGDWIFPVAGMLSGAICGWLYWRIAIGRTPRNGHAIEAE